MNYLKDLFKIEGKVAVITGGGGVLASEIGGGLSKAGVKIAMLDINEEAAKEAAKKIEAQGGTAVGLKSNVLDIDDLKKVRDEILKQFGKVDILLNAAGGNMPGATVSPESSVFDLNIKDLDKVTALNYNGTLLPSLVFGEVMAKQQFGNIVNISSMAAMQALTRVIGYSAAKAAVSNLTTWMAAELAIKFGGKIRVNAIAPGFFIGNQNRALLINPDGSYTERGQQVINKTPMRRFGEAHELVGAVLYLVSDSASFVTGVVFPIDGGFSSFSGV